MTTIPPVLVKSLAEARARTTAGANATFLVPIRAAVPAATAASAPTPTPAVFAETGVASATRFQASLRVSVSEHARKTNGVPDEPPREMRTCASIIGRRGGGRRARVGRVSRSRCAPDGASCRISVLARSTSHKRVLLLDLDLDSLFSALGPDTVVEVRRVESDYRRGPGLKNQRTEGDFGPLERRAQRVL